MIYYMGKTFDKKENRQYKTEKNGLKAAQEQNLNLYDEEGKLIYAAQEATEGAGSPEQPEAENSTPEAEKAQEGAQDASTGASEDDGEPEAQSAAPEPEKGQEKGAEGAGSPEQPEAENSTPEAEKTQEGAQDASTGASEDDEEPEAPQAADGVTEVKGKIRRVFGGVLRVRRRPSWEEDAVAGVTNFTEKNVKALHIVDGKPMYETTDGYFISGDQKHVEFVEN